MRRYTVSGISAATAATSDHAVAALWNAGSERIAVKEIHVSLQTATACIPRLARATARGTAGSTITPTIVNDHDRLLAPPSGALLDLAAYSAQPTLEALRMHSFQLTAAIGSAIMWVMEVDITIPTVNGLVLTTGSAVAFPASVVTFSWTEC